VGAGGKINQALYAHMNNKRKNKKISTELLPLENTPQMLTKRA
jgi:hypothetical protein